jgi:membrane protein YdbS with pleckstrin-like domain
MGYVEDLLATNEQIVYTTKKHWVAPLFATVTGTVLTVVGLIGLVWQFPADGWLQNVLLGGGAIALIIGLVLLGKAFIEWWSESYVVTNHKVMKVSGILRKTAEGSALEKINDITISQSLLGRSLGYGTLSVLTAADESNLHYTSMREPMEFRRAILDQKQLFEQADALAIADAVRQAPAAPAAAPAAELAGPANADEIANAIERLAQMRDAGHITPEEFEAKKSELLDRL